MGAVIAVSANVPGEVSLYNIVLFLHITGAVVGLGALFLLPVFLRMGRQVDRGQLPLVHRVQSWFAQRVITPALTLVLFAGVYMAIDGPYDFGEPFVGAGLLIIVVILGLGGAYLAPRERRLLELVERDVAGAGGGAAAVSGEYLTVSRQVERVIWINAGLAVLAIFLMVTKLGS